MGLTVPLGEGEEDWEGLPVPDTLPETLEQPLPVTDTVALALPVVDKEGLVDVVIVGETLPLSEPLTLPLLLCVDEEQEVDVAEPHAVTDTV